MKKTGFFLKEYCQKLSDEHVRFLYGRLSQRLGGDLAEADDVAKGLAADGMQIVAGLFGGRSSAGQMARPHGGKNVIRDALGRGASPPGRGCWGRVGARFIAVGAGRTASALVAT